MGLFVVLARTEGDCLYVGVGVGRGDGPPVLLGLLPGEENSACELATEGAAGVDDVGVVLFAEDKVDDDLEERFFHR